MTQNNNTFITVRAWMDSMSTAGRLHIVPGPKSAPKTMMAEHWDGRKWVARKLQWNGTEYVEVAS